MKKKEILKQLNAEFDRLTPDMSDRVKNQPIEGEFAPETVPVYAEGGGSSGGKDKRKLAAVFAAVAVLFIAAAVMLVFLMPAWRSGCSYRLGEGYISIETKSAGGVSLLADVEPKTAESGFSLFLVTDSDGKVVNVTAGDRAAEILLAGVSAECAAKGESLTGGTAEETVRLLSEKARALGYLAGGTLSLISVSAQGGAASEELAKSAGESAQSGAGAGVSVVSSAGDEAYLRAALGVSEGSVEDLLTIAAEKKGYLSESAEELFSGENSGANEAYYAYLFELLEEYIDLLEDRAEAIDELFEICMEIKEELGLSGLAKPVIVWDEEKNAAVLNPDIEGSVGKEWKEEFEEAMEECAEAGFIPHGDEDLYLYRLFYSSVDFELAEEILECFEDTVTKINEVLEKIKELFAGQYLEELIAEWASLTDGWSQSSFTDPEDYIEAMSEAFEREYERLLGRG